MDRFQIPTYYEEVCNMCKDPDCNDIDCQGVDWEHVIEFEESLNVA
jgi:hypothetical protein